MEPKCELRLKAGTGNLLLVATWMLLLLLLLMLLLLVAGWAVLQVGSVAKFLRGGGGGGEDVAVVKCNERRQAVRRCIDSATAVDFVPAVLLPRREDESCRDSIICWAVVDSSVVVEAAGRGGSVVRLLTFHGCSANFLGGSGVTGRAFFMSESLTDGPVDAWALAGEARENWPHLVASAGLVGGKVAMGGATCFSAGAVPPMLALWRLRMKGFCLLAAKRSLGPRQVDTGRAARGFGKTFKFSCERDLAAFSGDWTTGPRRVTSRLIGGATVTP